MPHLRLETNLPNDRIPEDFVVKATGVIAVTLGKPESYCVVSVIPNLPMAFGGNTDPCAIATLMSIGSLGVSENKEHSAAISKLITEVLGIPNDRMYIHFINAGAADVGFKGITFHDIFGGRR